MLPTKGYFQDIECPYFDNSCGRPYCHFRHRKKQLDLVAEDSIEETNSKEVPSYKPTPKSELAVSRSHIPISYVPDIIYRAEKPLRSNTVPKTTFLAKPTYKPTPISLLTSAVKNYGESEDNSLSDLKQSIANTKYSPEAEHISQFEYKPTALEDKLITENLEKHEYKPSGDSSSNNVHYNPTALEDICEHNSSDIVYKPTADNVPSIDYKPSACLVESSSIDFENLDSEFDMIDEIINMSDKTKNFEAEVIQSHVVKEEKQNKNHTEIKRDKVGEDKKNSKSHKHSKKDKSTNKKYDQNKKSSKTKSDEKNNKDKKKHETKHKDSTRKSSSHEEKPDREEKSSSHGEKPSDREEKSSSREEKKSSNREEKSFSREEKSSNREEKSSSRDEKHSAHKNYSQEEGDNKEKYSKHRDKEKIKEKGESKSKDRNKDKNGRKDKEKNKDKGISIKSKENENKGVKEKDKNDKGKEHKHDKKEKVRHKHSKHDGEKHKPTEKGKHKYLSTEQKTEMIDLQNNEKRRFSLEDFESGDDSTPNIDNIDVDIDIDADDDETMRECYRIFNEYTPTEVQPQIVELDNKLSSSKDETLEEQVGMKKRIAHSNAPSTSAKFQHPKPSSRPSPGQIMNNRFKLIKAMQANDEEKLIMNEVKRVVKRPSPTPIIEAAKKHKLQKPSIFAKPISLVDDIINGHKSKPTQKKIAPVANVMNIQRAKAQLEELNKKRAAELMTRTVVQTNKIGKRQAHVPEYSLNDIPDVLDIEKSKLPVNVRTRFLTMLADECCKLYLSQSDAYKRALDEEYSCYQKCKVLVTYRNSAMLAVNRIRKEIQEREQKNLGLVESGESSFKRGEGLERISLYKQIEQYILTEEELDIHGYPKESVVPGRAIIKNRRIVPSVNLPKNQKKCSRCSKIYLVDDDGRVIYEEECLYHPLKKRTIRGEQIHLCCKSADDYGCVTSHTHVSEMSEDAELEGFQATLPPDSEDDQRSSAVYALDCEMCYTTKGLELTRVTVVDSNCKTVYESLVKPLNEIIDYNTRFSGITKQQMDRINTGILQVQANILHLCNSKTILIGHSLESDMKALKIIHGTVIDTSVLFPHKMGLPHKKALRTLACDYLKKIIQNDVGGHDSAEDAITCMELVKWKVKEDSKFKFSK